MNKSNYIFIIFIIAFLCYCGNKSSPSFENTERETIAEAIRDLTILSELDTTRIEFLDDSLLQKLSNVEGFEQYLTNISKDSLIKIEDLLNIYREINKDLHIKQQPVDPIKNR